MGTGLGREDGGERDGAWVGTGLGGKMGERDGRGMDGDGKMEGSETGGAWVGMGLGREDGDGRRMGEMEGSETGGA